MLSDSSESCERDFYYLQDFETPPGFGLGSNEYEKSFRPTLEPIESDTNSVKSETKWYRHCTSDHDGIIFDELIEEILKQACGAHTRHVLGRAEHIEYRLLNHLPADKAHKLTEVLLEVAERRWPRERDVSDPTDLEENSCLFYELYRCECPDLDSSRKFNTSIWSMTDLYGNYDSGHWVTVDCREQVGDPPTWAFASNQSVMKEHTYFDGEIMQKQGYSSLDYDLFLFQWRHRLKEDGWSAVDVFDEEMKEWRRGQVVEFNAVEDWLRVIYDGSDGKMDVRLPSDSDLIAPRGTQTKVDDAAKRKVNRCSGCDDAGLGKGWRVDEEDSSFSVRCDRCWPYLDVERDGAQSWSDSMVPNQWYLEREVDMAFAEWGPFDANTMETWFEEGNCPKETRMRCSDTRTLAFDTPYMRIEEFFYQGHSAFLKNVDAIPKTWPDTGQPVLRG